MVKIFLDSADLKQMREAAKNPLVKGYTTNPTLCRKAGVKDYREFGQRAAREFNHYPISLEVFADDFDTMAAQAKEIASWGENVYVKIPVTNTKGESSGELIAHLSHSGIKVNVTAVMTREQIDEMTAVLLESTPAVISVFAGRIADTGRNPVPIMSYALMRRRHQTHEILWASPRQVLDVYRADDIFCDIITCTPDLIAKLSLRGKPLKEYSRETVHQFFDDATQARYSL